ncbi:membrane protein [Streptomyces eurocidicus]|uniref:Membrane protein n=1 Tax=Streptomyces eurocidicus TaxID=66423 RepID=A0A2N8NV44_STREU|nr:membrane protein [Streptomyces eurocidicus]
MGAPAPRSRLWLRCLVGGLVLWLVTVVVTYGTRNTNLLPTVILLGSFLTPTVFALWAYERDGRGLGADLLMGSFAIGGLLGVLGASVLETYLLHPSVGLFLGVGLIEEAVKLIALMLVLRRRPRVRGVRAGTVLGAAVGFGFAAFESAGYAFNAAVTAGGLDLRALVETEILRGLLAPFGHGLWTAVAGGVLLAHREPGGRFRFPAPVVVTYLGVAVLHALWDSVHGIAVLLVVLLTRTSLEARLFADGYVPRPTAEQRHLFTLFSVGGLVVVTLVGLGWLRALVRGGSGPGRTRPAADP